ncbi:hypothetical protein [Nocardia transvalensis]|uniref:hypothetical protein n=1 Tax=Nocardia transvalensis TaxID=37333 RepID=UPI0018933C4A|nr:hypothetical protein [Nocardia transvalensis]MBF6332973.1 hypothetical protein [Nocardia transvalensis]
MGAAEPPPSLCSSQEEQDRAANEARCHAQRAASAAFRARETLDYAQRQEASLDKPANVKYMQAKAAQADEAMKRAADAAERNDAKDVLDAEAAASEASFSAFLSANELAVALGACQQPEGALLLTCIGGVHGEAYDAAENAYAEASHIGSKYIQDSVTSAVLVTADEAEADAVAAYQKAGWIVPEES